MSDRILPNLIYLCAWFGAAGVVCALWMAADRLAGRSIERHVSNALDYDDTPQGWAERADRVPDDGLAPRPTLMDDYEAADSEDYR